MKKIILGLVALSAVSMAAGTDGMYIVPSVGLDLGSEYDHYDTDGFFAGEMSVEALFPMNEQFDLGFGIAFQKHADVKDYWDDHHKYDEAYNSIPFYGTAKFNFPGNGEIQPFMKVDLGYSINSGDFDNGMYFGIGGGLQYQNYVFDLMYKVNNAEWKDWGIEEDYSRFAFGFGYRFDQ